MPKALKLTLKNIPLIADTIGVKNSDVWDDFGEAEKLGQTRYFVTDVTVNNIHYDWLNVREDYFMEHFNYIEGRNETQFDDVFYIP